MHPSLSQLIALTTFQWTKGYTGDRGNKEANCLAKKGANKPAPDILNLEIPKELDLQGVKMLTLMQSITYHGILEHKLPWTCPTTALNLHHI